MTTATTASGACCYLLTYVFSVRSALILLSSDLQFQMVAAATEDRLILKCLNCGSGAPKQPGALHWQVAEEELTCRQDLQKMPIIRRCLNSGGSAQPKQSLRPGRETHATALAATSRWAGVQPLPRPTLGPRSRNHLADIFGMHCIFDQCFYRLNCHG
jgi:hypothetical protein